MVKEITKPDLKDKINSFLSFREMIYPVYEDGKYYTTTKEGFREIIQETQVEDLEYISDKFDCDNFSGYFKNLVALRYEINSVGKVLDFWNRHSYNLLVMDDDISFYEPQTDKLFSDRFNLKFGLLII